ncbi:MAG: PAS domain-containing protein [Flavobacteriaceae bacterium]
MKNDLSKMACLDIYLSGLSDEKYQEIEEEIYPSKNKVMPLKSWDVFDQGNYRKLNQAERQIDIDQIKSYAKRHRWKNDIEAIFEGNDFEAIVLTNDQQQIEWVNTGFTKMTGYSKKFAFKKSPSFLQGELTSKETKEVIRLNLEKNKPFKELIINYKKDNTAYKCEIKVFPLYSENTIHYIALERQVV